MEMENKLIKNKQTTLKSWKTLKKKKVLSIMPDFLAQAFLLI